MSLKGECFLLAQEYEKAAHVLSQVCTLFNRWKAGKKSFSATHDASGAFSLDIMPASVIDDQLEFGVDDYIKVRASLAEALMNMGKTAEAV